MNDILSTLREARYEGRVIPWSLVLECLNSKHGDDLREYCQSYVRESWNPKQACVKELLANTDSHKTLSLFNFLEADPLYHDYITELISVVCFVPHEFKEIEHHINLHFHDHEYIRIKDAMSYEGIYTLKEGDTCIIVNLEEHLKAEERSRFELSIEVRHKGNRLYKWRLNHVSQVSTSEGSNWVNPRSSGSKILLHCMSENGVGSNVFNHFHKLIDMNPNRCVAQERAPSWCNLMICLDEYA